MNALAYHQGKCKFLVAYKKPLLEVSNIPSGGGDSQFDSFKLFRDENLAAKSGPAKEV